MKRHLILLTAALLLLGGCRNCPWRRGAPCRGGVAFGPPACGQDVCGVDVCGTDVTYGTSSVIDPSCPDCAPSEYYGGVEMPGTVISPGPPTVIGPAMVDPGMDVAPSLPPSVTPMPPGT